MGAICSVFGGDFVQDIANQSAPYWESWSQRGREDTLRIPKYVLCFYFTSSLAILHPGQKLTSKTHYISYNVLYINVPVHCLIAYPHGSRDRLFILICRFKLLFIFLATRCHQKTLRWKSVGKLKMGLFKANYLLYYLSGCVTQRKFDKAEWEQLGSFKPIE